MEAESSLSLQIYPQEIEELLPSPPASLFLTSSLPPAHLYLLPGLFTAGLCCAALPTALTSRALKDISDGAGCRDPCSQRGI